MIAFLASRPRRRRAAPISDDPPWVRRAQQGETWDAFISYKSENVELARHIADRLIASGQRVWFAEYQILLSARDRFQEAIDLGIERTPWGIALTNDLYANSPHCTHEMTHL